MTVHDFPIHRDAPEDASRIDAAIDAATRRLRSLQHADGHWVGELEGDTILESEYLLLLQFMGWTDPVRFRRAAKYLRAPPLPTGGRALYPGWPPQARASRQPFFCFTLAGDERPPPPIR